MPLSPYEESILADRGIRVGVTSARTAAPDPPLGCIPGFESWFSTGRFAARVPWLVVSSARSHFVAASTPTRDGFIPQEPLLVGFPKRDKLVNQQAVDPSSHRRLGSTMHRSSDSSLPIEASRPGELVKCKNDLKNWLYGGRRRDREGASRGRPFRLPVRIGAWQAFCYR